MVGVSFLVNVDDVNDDSRLIEYLLKLPTRHYFGRYGGAIVFCFSFCMVNLELQRGTEYENYLVQTTFQR